LSAGSGPITPHTAQGLLSQDAEALRFCVISEIDLSQITADLTVLMTEVDRIEAIAAGKTPADADEPWPSDRPRGGKA
jgi:hypothetical protein